MPLRTRQSLALLLGVVAVLGGYRLFASPPAVDQPVADEKPQAKPDVPKHGAIMSVRDRMLEKFHGQSVDRFTSMDGFGLERMTPLYKEIPYEIPVFSTDDVEVDKAPPTPKSLREVYSKSIGEFLSPSPQKPAKNENDPLMVLPGRGTGFGRAFNQIVSPGLQLRLLDLVGLADPDDLKVYSGGKAFEVMRMMRNAKLDKNERRFEPYPDVKFDDDGVPILPVKKEKANEKAKEPPIEPRALDTFEHAGVLELRDGKDTFVRHKGNVIRMLGALRAGEQCIACHTGTKKGDLLGAFSYTFVDTHNSLKAELKGGSAKQ